MNTRTAAAPRRRGQLLNGRQAASHTSTSKRAPGTLSGTLILLALLAALVPASFVLAGTTTGGGTLVFGLSNIFDVITSQAVGLLAGLMLVGGGIAWGFSERDDGMRKLSRMGLAGGVMVGSAALVGTIFGAGI